MIPVNKLHHEFKLSVDKVDSLNSPNFLPNEIDALLWRGIKKWFLDTVKLNESHSEITNKLMPFRVLKEVVAFTNNNGVYEVDLTNLQGTFHTVTKLEVTISKNGCEKTCTSYHMRDNDLDTKYNDPSYDWCRVPYKTGSGSTPTYLYLYTDNDFTISEIRLSYLKLPNEPFFGGYNSLNGIYTSTNPTSVDSDIDDIYLNEIINYTLQEIRI